MGRLYEITERYKNLEALLDDPAIDNEELMEALGQVEDEFRTKIKNITHLVKDSEAHCNYLKIEEARINNRRKVLEKKIENLKYYIDANMKLKDIKKIDVGTFTLSLRKSPYKVEVVEITDIPSQYIKQIVDFKVDKKRILEDIKAGQSVDGVRVVQNESLTIR